MVERDRLPVTAGKFVRKGARIVLENVLAHPELQVPDPEFDAWCDRVIAALEAAKGQI